MSDKPLVVITHRFDHEVLLKSKFHPHLQVQFSKNIFDPSENFKKARGLILRSGHQVEQDLLDLFPNLEVLVTATSGFDHLNLDLLQKKQFDPITFRDHRCKLQQNLLFCIF